MSPALAQREAALAAMALLAAILSLAIAAGRHGPPRQTLPQPVQPWREARAAAREGVFSDGRTACGLRVGPETLGVAHPVLPCGVKLFVAFGKTEVLTQVIDRGPFVPGRDFDLTRALADKLGLVGVETIRWAFARPGTRPAS